MNQFNEQELSTLKELNEKHRSLRIEIGKMTKFLMETKNNVFILEHKKAGTLLELDSFNNYDEIYAYHSSIISSYRIRFFIIAIIIIAIILFSFGVDSIVPAIITAVIVSGFFTFGSAKRSYSDDILIFLKNQEQPIKKLYQYKFELQENSKLIYDIAGDRILHFINSQSMFSVQSIQEQGFSLVHQEIIELILEHLINKDDYEILEIADPKKPDKKTTMYKSRVAKNITTTHLQID